MAVKSKPHHGHTVDSIGIGGHGSGFRDPATPPASNPGTARDIDENVLIT
jgi:hypothetical protein